MERRQTGESGQAAGGSVPILGARHAAQVSARGRRTLVLAIFLDWLELSDDTGRTHNSNHANHDPKNIQ
jgi:hypothetical protein